MPVEAARSKPVSAFKRDAARLLKAYRAGDTDAHQRFDRLREVDQPQLKHALAVVAIEAGHDSWSDLKTAIDGVDFSEFFAGPHVRDSLNAWFTNYDEAKAYQQGHGGVVLPYRDHVFVTSLATLTRLGYETDHPDWKDIGYDFVRPASEAAHARITAALQRRFAARD